MSSASNLEETSGRGLSSEEARQRLARDGYNELPSATRRNTLAIALSIAREPMFLLLILSAIIYFILGDVRESLVLSLSLIVIFTITIFQERKTERALEALRDLSSPRAGDSRRRRTTHRRARSGLRRHGHSGRRRPRSG